MKVQRDCKYYAMRYLFVCSKKVVYNLESEINFRYWRKELFKSTILNCRDQRQVIIGFDMEPLLMTTETRPAASIIRCRWPTRCLPNRSTIWLIDWYLFFWSPRYSISPRHVKLMSIFLSSKSRVEGKRALAKSTSPKRALTPSLN